MHVLCSLMTLNWFVLIVIMYTHNCCFPHRIPTWQDLKLQSVISNASKCRPSHGFQQHYYSIWQSAWLKLKQQTCLLKRYIMCVYNDKNESNIKTRICTLFIMVVAKSQSIHSFFLSIMTCSHGQLFIFPSLSTKTDTYSIHDLLWGLPLTIQGKEKNRQERNKMQTTLNLLQRSCHKKCTHELTYLPSFMCAWFVLVHI